MWRARRSRASHIADLEVSSLTPCSEENMSRSQGGRSKLRKLFSKEGCFCTGLNGHAAVGARQTASWIFLALLIGFLQRTPTVEKQHWIQSGLALSPIVATCTQYSADFCLAWALMGDWTSRILWTRLLP